METTSNFKPENVIWAVDVFTDIQKVEETAAKVIGSFFTALKCHPKITPVNVFPGVHVGEYFPFAREEIQSRLFSIEELNLEPVTVIPENMIYPTSVDDKVLTLVDHAKSTHADLIIVTTHAQQTASHYLIGSFTNELLSQSPIPLLILNPACEVKPEFKNILYPLESGEFDEGEIQLIAGIAERLAGKVIFSYHIQDQATRYFRSESPMWKMLKVHQRKLEENIEEQKAKLQQALEKKISNFEIAVEIDTLSFKESISQVIRSKSISLALFGGQGSRLNKKISKGVIEFVMRNANCPVLIMK